MPSRFQIRRPVPAPVRVRASREWAGTDRTNRVLSSELTSTQSPSAQTSHQVTELRLSETPYASPQLPPGLKSCCRELTAVILRTSRFPSVTQPIVMDNASHKRNITRPVDDDSITSEATGETFDYNGLRGIGSEPRQIGVAGAMFLILNKMIGTGSRAPLFAQAPKGVCRDANPPHSLLNTFQHICSNRVGRDQLVTMGSRYVLLCPAH